MNRKTVEAYVGGRNVEIIIEDYTEDGGGVVISSTDGNHAFHLIGEDEWLLRDAAAIDGAIAIVRKDGGIRELRDDERDSWTHHGRVFMPAAPVPAFKVGEEDGKEEYFGDVEEHAPEVEPGEGDEVDPPAETEYFPAVPEDKPAPDDTASKLRATDKAAKA